MTRTDRCKEAATTLGATYWASYGMHTVWTLICFTRAYFRNLKKEIAMPKHARSKSMWKLLFVRPLGSKDLIIEMRRDSYTYEATYIISTMCTTTLASDFMSNGEVKGNKHNLRLSQPATSTTQERIEKIQRFNH